jgi:hypothetical protein
MQERVKEAWRAAAAEAGEAPEDFSPSFEQFALRDAEIRTGLPPTWPRLPYLVIATSHVAVFMPGSLGSLRPPS